MIDKEELDKQITDLVSKAIYEDKIKLLDIIAVLESAKMSIAIIAHESARKSGVI